DDHRAGGTAMSYVVAAPEMLAAASADLDGIRSALSAANAAAAAPTSGVLAAGADEVSAAIASLFSGHAAAYPALSAQAAGFHEQFIQAMRAGGAMYAGAEAANAAAIGAPLQAIGQQALQPLGGAQAALASAMGNLGSGNLGFGNQGNQNLGSGNIGNTNVGSGNN